MGLSKLRKFWDHVCTTYVLSNLVEKKIVQGTRWIVYILYEDGSTYTGGPTVEGAVECSRPRTFPEKSCTTYTSFNIVG